MIQRLLVAQIAGLERIHGSQHNSLSSSRGEWDMAVSRSATTASLSALQPLHPHQLMRNDHPNTSRVNTIRSGINTTDEFFILPLAIQSLVRLSTNCYKRVTLCLITSFSTGRSVEPIPCRCGLRGMSGYRVAGFGDRQGWCYGQR